MEWLFYQIQNLPPGSYMLMLTGAVVVKGLVSGLKWLLPNIKGDIIKLITAAIATVTVLVMTLVSNSVPANLTDWMNFGLIDAGMVLMATGVHEFTSKSNPPSSNSAG